MYQQMCATPSDIHEHLPTLREYALQCSHITECGVRNIVSTWAFAMAQPNKLVCVDPYKNPNIRGVTAICRKAGITLIFHEQSDLECPLEETDLLFLDTWHVYGHMKRELERWYPSVRKYIVLHDTSVDADVGESVRCRMNIPQQVKESGLSEDEIRKGIWPAVQEFLENHPEWTLHKRYTNNNGLTILKKME